MKIYVDGSKRAAVSRMFPYWKKLGHNVIDKPVGADVQLSVVKINVKRGIPTVLRLNGIYYDKADNYQRRNTEISKSHQTADAVIYQSRFSQAMCERYLSKRSTIICRVIYNGVEKDWNNYEDHEEINIVSCAKWRRHKRLPEIIEVFNEFIKTYPNSKLHIIGPMGKGAKQIPHGKVIYYGKLDFEQIKNIYKTGDISIHLSKKDSCPSSVVESIAAGMPVVTTNACGGATEMCDHTDNCCVVNGDEFTTNPDFIYKDPYNKLPKYVKSVLVNEMIYLADTKPRIIHPVHLTIEYTAMKYIEIMEMIT